VVVDRLAERLEARDDDRALAVGECDQDRADACMRDERTRAPDRSGHLVEREEVDQFHALARKRRRVPVLDETLLVGPEVCDRAQQPVEPRLVRADADEDHVPAENTLPAKRVPGSASASSGHCT
jgi:hypothetical protein